jgi:hypothetical protein
MPARVTESDMIEVVLNRRNFLRVIGGGAVATGFLSEAGAASFGVVKGVPGAVWQYATEFIHGLEATDALKVLTDSRAGFRIVTGTFNKQASVEGKAPQLSTYIDSANGSLNTVFCNAYKDLFEPQRCRVIAPQPVNINDDAFLIGGPLANEELAADLGYEIARITLPDARGQLREQYVPRTTPRFLLKYEHLHGDGQLGFLDGSLRFADRYDRGELVTRPQFAIRDTDTGRIMTCAMNGGLLGQEFLQIVRIRRPNGAVRLYMWGLHGHALEGFTAADVFKSNLNELVSRVEGIEQFQALVPMTLDVKSCTVYRYRMVATANWEDAEIVNLDERLGATV